MSAVGGDPPLTLTVLGCGDAFGSGGRRQACFHLAWEERALLLDCGASALTGLRAEGLDLKAVDTVVLSHLHGDHFAGLPFLLLQAQLQARRVEPLAVLGPPGTEARVMALLEVMFPGAEKLEWRFPLSFHEVEPGTTYVLGEIEVAAIEVDHPSGSPSLALRLELAGRRIAYTGDGAWGEEHLALLRDAELLIAESYTFELPVPYHLSYAELRVHLPALAAKKILLTHMSNDMLRRSDEEVPELRAEDGLRVQL